MCKTYLQIIIIFCFGKLVGYILIVCDCKKGQCLFIENDFHKIKKNDIFRIWFLNSITYKIFFLHSSATFTSCLKKKKRKKKSNFNKSNSCTNTILLRPLFHTLYISLSPSLISADSENHKTQNNLRLRYFKTQNTVQVYSKRERRN